VQAPHRATPHPNLVPVNPATSRNAQSSGMSSGTSSVTDFPLMVRVGIGFPSETWYAQADGKAVLRAKRAAPGQWSFPGDCIFDIGLALRGMVQHQLG
jgi:hypothetical protein